MSGANDVPGGVGSSMRELPHPALRAAPERAPLVSTPQVGGMNTADAVVPDAMTARIISDTPPRSRGAISPERCMMVSPEENEGVGNAGCPLHPQPRVGKSRTTRA